MTDIEKATIMLQAIDAKVPTNKLELKRQWVVTKCVNVLYVIKMCMK